MSASTKQPPKDGLVRAAAPGFEIRAAEEGGMPKLTGYMLRFEEPTEINSLFEGRFIEEIAPGATKRTLKNNGDNIRILFNHGRDPSIGMKALTEPRFVEDKDGVRYDEPELFDTSYNRDLIPGLESGQYGSSFKFRVIKETFDEEPGKSAGNPEGLPKRTIEELALYEGGPVTFPAYEGASAGCRSLTDHYFIEDLKGDPARFEELDELFEGWVRSKPERVAELLAAADERKAIAYVKTPTSDAAWDGPKVKTEIPDDAKAAAIREFFAWQDPSGNPDVKSSYRFIHHEITEGKAGPANIKACETGIGVLNGAQQGTTIPDSDRQGVYDHLAAHLKDAGRTPAELKKRSELEEVSEEEVSEEPAGSSDARTNALPDGPETSHSDTGTRKPPLGGNDRSTPPWRRSNVPTPPWRQREKEKADA